MRDAVVGRGVDRGPGHRQGAVADREVGRPGDAGGGELGLVVDRSVGLDGDHRVDRGQLQRDVGHVGRAAHPVSQSRRGRGTRDPAPGRARGRAPPGRRRCRTRCRRAPVEVARQLGAGGQRTRLEAGPDPGVQLVEFVEGLVAHQPRAAGALRHDVGRVAAVGHDAVDPVRRVRCAGAAGRCRPGRRSARRPRCGRAPGRPRRGRCGRRSGRRRGSPPGAGRSPARRGPGAPSSRRAGRRSCRRPASAPCRRRPPRRGCPAAGPSGRRRRRPRPVPGRHPRPRRR